MTVQRELKTDVLVVGSMRYGEADRILTLYTRERGRLSAIAKGVRRPKSRIGGRLEPFSLVRVVLYQGRTLYTVTGAETVRTFQGARDQLFRIEEGSRLLETVRRLFPEEERNTAAFNLLVRGVAHLSVAEDRPAAARVVLATRVKLLLAQGYLPELDTCVQCGADAVLCGFNPSLGGVLCRDCFTDDAHDCFTMTPAGLAALRALLDLPLAAIGDVDLEGPVGGEVERALTRVLGHHGH
jgi:DNA repair protein RecO (recombination protein O)